MAGFNVKGKVCLVTGGAQGLGKEFALKLLSQGGKVCLSDINKERGLETVQEFVNNGFCQEDVTFFRQDVSSKDQWAEVFRHCDDFFKGDPVEVLVNNAGLNGVTEGYEKVVDINLKAVLHGTNCFIEKYGKSKGGNGGRIVQLSSMAGLYNGLPWHVASYGVTKWGVVSLTRTFSECSEKKTYMPSKHDGVKAYCLCPFFVRTAMTKNLDEDLLKKKSGSRKLTIEEVGNVFMEAFRADIDGSVYMIFPDVPAFRVPNLNVLFFAIIPFLKIYHILFPQTIATDGGMVLARVVMALFLLTFLLGALFCYFCMNIF